MKSTAALYEEIGKRAIVAALQLGAVPRCPRCPVAECDGNVACEEQIADALWAREEEAS